MSALIARLRGLFVPAIDVEHAADAWPIVRAGLLLIAVAFGGLGLWMVFAPLSGAVVAPGFIKVDMNRKTVQHQEGGIVKEIRVRDGDHVKAGQVLIVIGDVRVDASFDLLLQQYDAERARNARLTAEKALTPRIDFGADLLARKNDVRVAETLHREQVLFTARRETLMSQIDLLDRQIQEMRLESAATASQIKAEMEALASQREELKANEDLLKQNFVGKVRVLTVQRAVLDYEARVGEHQAELSKSRQRITETELRKISLRTQFSQTAADELKDSTAKLFEIEERLRPSKDAATRQSVVAPVDGEVVDLKVGSVGAVIGPRDMLLDIVPADPRLVLEARIRPEDINHVNLGGPVDIRLTAFKFRTTPIVEGKVFYKSADRLIDRTAGAAAVPYYAVYIEVLPESLREAGNLKLLAGMPAEVFIRTAERTALQYLLDPALAYINRGFREP
jgi:epimerase transport system membrane fusion protein